MLDGTPRTRAELIKMTGLARSTVGARVDALLAAGLLTPSGEAASTGGRPPARLAFNPDAGVVIGADLGATHALVALTDLRGRVVAEKALRHRHLRPGPEPVLDRVARTARALLLVRRAHGRETSPASASACPGPVEHSTGRPVLPPIMPGWDDYDVPGHIARALGGPVLVDNDVNLMALGEHATVYPRRRAPDLRQGRHRHRRRHHQRRTAPPRGPGRGRRPRPRRRRSTAATPGAPAATSAASRRSPAARPSSGRSASEAWTPRDSRGLVRLAKRGDLEAAAAIREAGREIGHVLATCVSLFNPSVIAVGGLVAQAAESLLAGIREVVYGRSLPLATGELQIVASRTGGHAGVIGAATMVVQHVLSAEQVEHHLAEAAAG